MLPRSWPLRRPTMREPTLRCDQGLSEATSRFLSADAWQTTSLHTVATRMSGDARCDYGRYLDGATTGRGGFRGSRARDADRYNRADQILADSGVIRPEEVRTVTLDNVLVDTGATLLGLPADVIARLGLAHRQDRTVPTAAGVRTMRQFQDATITLHGRTGTFDCMELPAGSPALLGVIPVESLGLEPDVRNQTLRMLPAGPDKSHIIMLQG